MPFRQQLLVGLLRRVLTVYLVAWLDSRDADHRARELQMRMGLLVEDLRLAEVATGKRRALEVKLPVIEAERYVRRAGDFRAEEWAEHEVGGGEMEEGKDAQCAVSWTCGGE